MDKRYFGYVMGLTTLSREEERRLVLEAKAGSQRAKDQLVAHFMKLVISRARIVLSRIGKNVPGSTLDDLINDGVVGLLTAIDKYDPNHVSPNTDEPVRLSTYADTWIKVVVFGNAMRRKSLVYNLGSGKMKSVFFKLPKVIAEKGWEGRALTHEMAEAIATEISPRVTADEVMAMDRLRGGDMSLDARVGGQDGGMTTHMDRLVADDDVEERVHGGMIDSAIREEVMACCDEREAQILEARLFGEEKRTLQDIATEMGISKVRVKQIEAAATDRVIGRLRKRFAGAYGR